MQAPNYLGYKMSYEGISVNCPALRLRGYRDDLALARAMYRLLQRRGKLPEGALKPAAWFDALVKASS